MLLSLFFLVVLFLLAQAFHVLLPSELNSALRFKTDTNAYFVADAAIEDCVAWLEYELQNGREVQLLGQPSVGRSGTLGDWQWTATIQPDAQTPPNGINPLRVYRIVTTATLGTRDYRRITTWVGQQSFAKFVLYNDKTDSGSFIPVDKEHYNGPVHSNDPLRLYVPGGFYGSALPPAFTSSVTTASLVTGSADGVGYLGPGGVPYDASGNPKPGYYEKIYEQGRQALRTGVRRVEMPPNTASLATAAWGQTGMNPPNGRGVYVQAESGSSHVAGGVYIVGAVDSMTLSVDAGGNRVVKIMQAGKQTTVTETLGGPLTAPNGAAVAQGKTLIVGEGNQVQVMDGITNGVIYSTGTIAALKGTNKGARTIAADAAASSEIVIAGSLTRSDTPLGSNPPGNADNLGLVGYQVRVPTTVTRSYASPLYLYCAMVAGLPGGRGGFVVDQYWNAGLGLGSIQMYGSLSASYQGVNGTQDGNGNLYAGFKLDFHYDNNLAVMPPPYFPTFAKLNVKSWREESLVR